MVDYFVAAMKCPNCGTISPADSSTQMQTHIRDDGATEELPVGTQLDPLEVRPEDLESSGYLPIPGAPRVSSVRLLERWWCPTCKHENWASIALANTTIADIAPVLLDRSTLMASQFIARSCYGVAAKLSGLPIEDLMTGKIDPVKVLLEKLP